MKYEEALALARSRRRREWSWRLSLAASLIALCGLIQLLWLVRRYARLRSLSRRSYEGTETPVDALSGKTGSSGSSRSAKDEAGGAATMDLTGLEHSSAEIPGPKFLYTSRELDSEAIQMIRTKWEELWRGGQSESHTREIRVGGPLAGG